LREKKNFKKKKEIKKHGVKLKKQEEIHCSYFFEEISKLHNIILSTVLAQVKLNEDDNMRNEINI
jgi:hypothetical protein